MDYFLGLCAVVLIVMLWRALVWLKRINGQIGDYRRGIKPPRDS